MPKKPIDDDDRKKALRKVVRDTVTSAGALAPDEVPHRVRDRAERHGEGRASVNDYADRNSAKRPKR